MSFNLGRLLLVSTAATAVGVAVYAVYKVGGVKPAACKVVKGGVKAETGLRSSTILPKTRSHGWSLKQRLIWQGRKFSAEAYVC